MNPDSVQITSLKCLAPSVGGGEAPQKCGTISNSPILASPVPSDTTAPKCLPLYPMRPDIGSLILNRALVALMALLGVVPTLELVLNQADPCRSPWLRRRC